MLKIAAEVPPGVLVGGEEALVAQTVLRSGGVRFVARAADVRREDGRIAGWAESLGAGVAVAATPNSGNSRFEAGPPGAMTCDAGVNCGFVVPDFASAVEQFSVAVIYRSTGEAKTLAAVSTGKAGNMIFLAESAGRVVLKDRENTAEVSLPAEPTARARLVVGSYDGRTLRLRLDGREAEVQGRIPEMRHRADFLIGCRSNRPGLTKTLGQSLLHEVMFWPDHALSATGSAEDAAVLRALERYMRWGW